MKRVLILGASGRTGRFAVDYALSKQLEVAALVRNPRKLSAHGKLTLVPGSPERLSDVERAIPGCDAVLSFLNNQRASDSPWAKQVSPPRLLASAIANSVEAMKRHGIRRVVVLSAAGAGDSYPHTPWLWRWLIRNTNLKVAYDDHAAQEEVLRSSGLDWTAVRAVGFAGSGVKRTKISYDGQPKPGLTISRKQVATFMIDCLGHPEFYGKAPIASTA